MTRVIRIELEATIFMVIAAIIGGFFAFRYSLNNQNNSNVLSPIVANSQITITPEVNRVLKIDNAEQISPDGNKKLLMQATHNSNGTTDYEFSVLDVASNNKQQVYNTTLSATESASIPFNTWSPDDKYFFIQKNTTDAFVFNASGSPISGNQQYFDIADTWSAKGITNAMSETIGWASPTLLIVNTTTSDNAKGPSYWYEVPSTAIIQLASQF